MICDILLLASSGFILGLVIRWCFSRAFNVIALRERLFGVRNQLWDAAHRLHRFDDPAYVKARRVINANIRTAGDLSIPLVIFLMTRGLKMEEIKSDDRRMQAAIDQALQQTQSFVFEYLFCDTIFGRLVSFLIDMMSLKEWLRRKMSGWVRSEGPALLAR